MPLQNRVDPFGAIFRSPARGTLMGNRGGPLHNDRREIVRQCNGRRWIACVLEFRGRHRLVMTPGRYTELFFLDEAVALAAGHRPCAECRRERFNAFKSAWGAGDVRAPAIDEELHRARIDGEGKKVTYEAALDSLPDGCFIAIESSAYLVWDGSLLLWTPERYAARIPRTGGAIVTVLTPRSAVECLCRGYEVQVHESARALNGASRECTVRRA